MKALRDAGVARVVLQSGFGVQGEGNLLGDAEAAVRALDRVLTAGRYVMPIWYSDRARIAHRKELKYPAKIPLYGDWLGFQRDTWWYQAD